MALMIQKYLREGGTLEQLEETYHIKAKVHPKFQNLVCLKYNQIESDFSIQLVRECRGIILDAQNNWSVVCYSFEKFLNYGELLANQIDWSTARVEEKVDGSLMQLYYYGGKWQVASSGTPDAGGFVMSLQGQDSTQTFADLFWQSFKTLGIKEPDPLKYWNYTFTLELCTPQNRVIVHHPQPKLVLLGVRNNTTLEQFRTEPFGQELGCPVIQTYDLTSWDQVLDHAKTLDPLQQEGFVVVNHDFSRVKLKTEQYVRIAHLRDSKCSPARLLEVVRANEGSEFLAYFPEWKPLYESICQKFETLAESVNLDYERLKSIQVQKDFALEAVKTRCSGALFQMRQGRVKTSHEFLRTMTLKNLAGLLNLSDVEEKPLEE
jgi:hypothetical protein